MAQLGPQFPGLGGHPEPVAPLDRRRRAGPVRRTGRPLQGRGGRRRRRDRAPARAARPGRALPELVPALRARATGPRPRPPGAWTTTAARCGWWPTTRTSARLELRIPGADVSPHHCAWRCSSAPPCGASRSGSSLRRRCEAPAGRPRPAPAPRRCPGTSSRRPSASSASAAARDLFGSAFVEHYAAARRVEAAACHRFVSDEERARYLAQV